MSLNSNAVYIGKPEQETTGAVATAPVGTTLPTDARSVLPDTYVTGGYVSEDGVSLSADQSTNDIIEWSGSKVRSFLEEFTGTVTYTELQTDKQSMERIFGPDYVTATDATTTSGNALKVAIGNHLPDPQTWVFSMKDGNRRLRIVIPNGQVTSFDEVTFVRNDAVKWGVTISCLDDGTGNSVYLYTDDGQMLAAAALNHKSDGE